MRWFGLFLAFLSLAFLFVPCAVPAFLDMPAPDFQRDVVPILDAKCNRCHGGRKRDGKLDLRTRETMLKGGSSGPAIMPGNSTNSLLIELIHFNEMPPKKDKNRVSPAELKLLKTWVDAGAPDSPKKP